MTVLCPFLILRCSLLQAPDACTTIKDSVVAHKSKTSEDSFLSFKVTITQTKLKKVVEEPQKEPPKGSVQTPVSVREKEGPPALPEEQRVTGGPVHIIKPTSSDDSNTTIATTNNSTGSTQNNSSAATTYTLKPIEGRLHTTYLLGKYAFMIDAAHKITHIFYLFSVHSESQANV